MRLSDVIAGWNLLCFNPRTRKGCDLLPVLDLLISKVSIHAPVKDATFMGAGTTAVVASFNPRTRKGCDILPS